MANRVLSLNIVPEFWNMVWIGWPCQYMWLLIFIYNGELEIMNFVNNINTFSIYSYACIIRPSHLMIVVDLKTDCTNSCRKWNLFNEVVLVSSFNEGILLLNGVYSVVFKINWSKIWLFSQGGLKCSFFDKVVINWGCTLLNVASSHVSCFQEPCETLGISVAGGVNNLLGDIPIYVSNINPDGCLGKSQQIQVWNKQQMVKTTLCDKRRRTFMHQNNVVPR